MDSLEAALGQCLPSLGVLSRVVPIDTAPPFDHAQEAALVAGAVAKRQREFATGRALAHQLLTELGAPDQPLLPGARRAPGWPSGYLGSITHSDSFCAVAVARAASLALIGIDVEEDAPLPEKLVPRILGPEERAARDGLAEVARERRGRLVFSAKECIYKALAPLLERVLGFDEIEVRFADDTEADGSFMTRFVQPEARPDGCPEVVHGRWMAREGALLSVIALPPADRGGA